MPNVKENYKRVMDFSYFPRVGNMVERRNRRRSRTLKAILPCGGLSNCGTWLRHQGGANVVMDLGQTVEKSTKSERYGSWATKWQIWQVFVLQPNLRVQPMVIDPFSINELDYYLVSHFHSDHIDPYSCSNSSNP